MTRDRLLLPETSDWEGSLVVVLSSSALHLLLLTQCLDTDIIISAVYMNTNVALCVSLYPCLPSLPLRVSALTVRLHPP